ncbi:helix-turn-helix domain-containing protein [Listeria weihenstephanensis]|uniref:Helix-turn-helix domain-containing protein n=1 Tax=Listeria weihenstephanensis TaxID=1006155 RepID=A0A841Z5U8_9LIST|nr:Rgg/GadR/MutR family transcriptional regulator [Listeria weihenstephanensis]MBC1499696.1 helix-turn-helix domain-containing protein [Listeria weihenstephanensis]
MNFGETIKKIRTDKNLTQAQLSEGIMARNHLSQVENNNYFPAYDKFFSLIDRLNVNFEEFLYVQDGQKILFSRKISSQLSQAASLNNSEELSSLVTEANELYAQTGNITYYHSMLICKALIAYNLDLTVSQDMIDHVTPIKEYLFSIDNWYLYELKLFNNIIYALTLEEALLFSRTSFKKLDICKHFSEFQHIEQYIYMNLSTLCLEYGNFQAAKNFSENAIDTAKNFSLVYEMVCSKLNHAIACIKLEQTESAYDVIKKNMLILEYLEFDNLHEHFSTFLKKFEIEVKV